MAWHFTILPLILLLPGYFTLHLPLWGKASNTNTTVGQRLFLSLLISVLTSGLIGLVLAQVGIFSLGSLLLALVAYSVFCLAFMAAKRTSDSRFSIADSLNRKSRIENRKFTVSAGIRLGREDAIIIILLCLSFLLYAKPGEYILGWLDAGWYVNTGAHIAKTGALTGESPILSSLPPSAKSLFYNSSASLRERFAYFPDTEARGIYLWSFAVADPDRGKLTAYHPPLFSVWIAIFYALGGLRFSLYATPFFGALSVLSLYFAGKAMFGRKVGLLAAVLLAISFTQTYFSRVPYSEILSQCLLFSGVYALTTWTMSHSVIASEAKQSPASNCKQRWRLLRHFVPRNDRLSGYIVEHKPLYAAIAALCFGQAILCRIEGLIVILPLAIFFGCWLVTRRRLPTDFRFFAIPFGLLLIDGGILALTVSRPYVELNSYGLWIKLRSLLTESPALLVISAISLGGLLVLITLRGLSHPLGARSESRLNPLSEGQHLLTSTVFSLAILLLAIYAYFIAKSENVVQLGQFVSPLGLWLGLFGLVELIRRNVNEKTAFFLTLLSIHGVATISVLAISSTPSYVYPIRRQVPVLIPSLILLASYAILIWDKGGKLMIVDQLTVIGILLVSFLALSVPYVNYREMPNTIAFSEKLASYFGQDDIVVFEEIWFQDSRVGHFAAPLWSVYDKDALLISTAHIEEEESLTTTITQWLDEGRGVYFVSQWDPPFIPRKGYNLVPIAEESWRSSTITTVSAFPPTAWEFEIPVYI